MSYYESGGQISHMTVVTQTAEVYEVREKRNIFLRFLFPSLLGETFTIAKSSPAIVAGQPDKSSARFQPYIIAGTDMEKNIVQ